ncbi:MAG: class I SAM-dependent methyltransferase [Polyangiaceae bacterium]|nr:class I SAM-dependent methyltransferase [Polyangiaceae bacterium]
MSLWDRKVLPFLIEKACRSGVILEERRRHVPRAAGRVLEIGVGTGLNLPFYDASKVSELIAIDPSPELLERARARASQGAVRPTLLQASATALPLDSGSVDTAVMTYTLCSVDRPELALRELRRVLKPGGKLLFVEHGLARSPSTQRWQRALTPVWKKFSGGCHLDRPVREQLEEAGFFLEEIEEKQGDGPSWTGYTYEGIARSG